MWVTGGEGRRGNPYIRVEDMIDIGKKRQAKLGAHGRLPLTK